MRLIWIILAGFGALYAASACERTEPSASVLAAAQATPVQTDTSAPFDAMIEFKSGKDGVNYLSTGWMPNEVWGTWTKSSKEPGAVVLPVNRDKLPAAISLEYWGILTPTFPSEEFELTVAGEKPIALKSTVENPIVTQIIPIGPRAIDEAKKSGSLVFRIFAPNGKSPKQLGINQDDRVLGFGIRQMKLLSSIPGPTPDTPPVAARATPLPAPMAKPTIIPESKPAQTSPTLEP